jgi:hypothetical protein
MAKLNNTSETSIAITFLVMNLSALLSQAFWLFSVYFITKTFWDVFWLQSLVKAMFRHHKIDKTYIAEALSNSLIFLNAVF